MLVITRRIGEKFRIGDDIIITIEGTRGNQVRIGIKAPDDIEVLREELYERKKDGQHWDESR